MEAFQLSCCKLASLDGFQSFFSDGSQWRPSPAVCIYLILSENCLERKQRFNCPSQTQSDLTMLLLSICYHMWKRPNCHFCMFKVTYYMISYHCQPFAWVFRFPTFLTVKWILISVDFTAVQKSLLLFRNYVVFKETQKWRNKQIYIFFLICPFLLVACPLNRIL